MVLSGVREGLLSAERVALPVAFNNLIEEVKGK